MTSRGVRRTHGEEEEESYFISMADMMVGLLFVFIILLLYFALQFRQTTDALSGADQTRATILDQLETRLTEHGLRVTIDTETGVLHLPEDVLFNPGEAELTSSGQKAVAIIGSEMARVLPCYTYPRPATGCSGSPQRIDAIFVEGHTDRDPMTGKGLIRDNLDLSVVRATNTYRALRSVAPSLGTLRSGPTADAPGILSVSGYGDTRPVDRGDGPAAKQRNRRIDLRFLMITPQAQTRFADILDRR